MSIGLPPVRLMHLLMAIAAISSGSVAFADAGTADQGEVISLTPQQKQEALDSGGGRIRSQSLPLSDRGPSRQIHGEIGAMVGTGGARGIYGTTAIPIGENGGAIFSFEKSEYGRGRGWAPVCTDPRCRLGLGNPIP